MPLDIHVINRVTGLINGLLAFIVKVTMSFRSTARKSKVRHDRAGEIPDAS